MIGRVATGRFFSTVLMRRRPVRATADLTRADYQFYDKLRRGLADGLTVAGLLVKPINAKIASWVLGKAPQWEMEDEDSAVRFNEWWSEHHQEFLGAYDDAIGLGDCYVVINADLSVTVVSPEVVEPLVAEDDYSKLIGWRIVQRYDHPGEWGKWMIETNEYYAARRVRTVEYSAGRTVTTTYRNLIGVVPVVHVPNRKTANEFFGAPEVAPLVATKEGALYRYDDIFDAAANGNIMKGRPTPTIKFKDISALDDFWAKYAEKHVDDEGNEYYEIPFDADKLMLMVGEFEYATPGDSANDAKMLLELLYWLIIEHCEIPDIIMGTEMGQSRSSGMDQIETFIRFIETRRTWANMWVRQVADIAARLLALTESGFRYGGMPVPVYEELRTEDGQLRQTVVSWALAEGLIDRKLALMLAPSIDVDDPAAAVEEADKEREERDPARNDVDFDRELDDAIRRNEAATEGS